jgi:tetratricopeptide (TPR) repeat protein
MAKEAGSGKPEAGGWQLACWGWLAGKMSCPFAGAGVRPLFMKEHAMFRIVKAAVTLVALVGVYQVAAGANGVSMPPPSAAPSASPSVSRALTPDEMAVEAYNSGISHRDRAAKAEGQSEKDKKDSDRVKNDKKAREEHQKALKDFTKAAGLNPSMPQAFNGMGFSYRKLGDYAKALENYDRALQLSPKFPDAIEYRGEAYLALNRLDDAKQSYLTLFAMDRKQAESLMTAMKDYVAKKKVDPAGVDTAALSAFESWITERAGVAEETQLMAFNAHHGSWR